MRASSDDSAGWQVVNRPLLAKDAGLLQGDGPQPGNNDIGNLP